MRAVPATYRLAAKAAPTRASPYVSSIARPLRSLLQPALHPRAAGVAGAAEELWSAVMPRPHAGAAQPATNTAGVQSELPSLLLGDVAADVVTAVDSTLAAVLDSMSQVEASLGWLRKAQSDKAAAGGAGSQPASVSALGGTGAGSESERVAVQLGLDVMSIARDLGECGAARVEEMEPYQRSLSRLAAWRSGLQGRGDPASGSPGQEVTPASALGSV
jgi:hypothetical protein